MKKKRFNEAKIMHILKQAESGIPALDLCREHGMSSASFYKWRAKYGGMDASKIAEMKAMAAENRRLKSKHRNGFAKVRRKLTPIEKLAAC